MRDRAMILAVALTMASCGGGEDTPPPPLDAGFEKTWQGDSVMTCPATDPLVGSASLPITVTGNSLVATLGCLGGSTVTLTYWGSGATASWIGSSSCPPASYGTCATWVFTRTSASMTLNANGTLSASSVGTLVGCGVTVECTMSFSGT